MSVIQTPKVFAFLAWIVTVTVTVDLGKFQLHFM